MFTVADPRAQVFVAAGVANLLGDMFLILQLRMGIGGAAIATTAAQWAGALFFLGYMRRQARRGASVQSIGKRSSACLTQYTGSSTNLKCVMLLVPTVSETCFCHATIPGLSGYHVESTPYLHPIPPEYAI